MLPLYLQRNHASCYLLSFSSFHSLVGGKEGMRDSCHCWGRKELGVAPMVGGDRGITMASLWHLAYVTQSALGSGILKENQNQASMEQRWWGRLSIQVLGSSRVSYRSQTAEARVLNPVSLCSLNKKYWMRRPWETAAKRSRCEPRLPLSSQGTTFVSSTSRNLSIFTSTVH